MRREAYSYRNDASVPTFADDKPVIVFDGECIFVPAGCAFCFATTDGRNIAI